MLSKNEKFAFVVSVALVLVGIGQNMSGVGSPLFGLVLLIVGLELLLACIINLPIIARNIDPMLRFLAFVVISCAGLALSSTAIDAYILGKVEKSVPVFVVHVPAPDISSHETPSKTTAENHTPIPSASEIAKELSKLIPPQTGEPEIVKIRAEALSVIRGLSSMYDKWEDTDHFWQSVPPAMGTKETANARQISTEYHRQNNRKELSDKYSGEYRARVITARDSLLGRIQRMPERPSNSENSYRSRDFPSELFTPMEVRTQICDLIILLNAMESENGLSPSALDIRQKYYCH